jgi:hypothetical protein
MHEPRETSATPVPFTAPDAIGFPPPQLGPEPVRLAVLACAPGILALEKPGGVAWDAGPPGVPAIMPALRARFAEKKPGLAALGLENPVSIWPLDTWIAGIGLVASRGGEPFGFWRNAFGSGLVGFTYELLVCADAGRPAEHECALPVATHHDGSRAVISHETGRKSRTLFRRVTTGGDDGAGQKPGARWEWWTAMTCYPRFHQIRIHAAECGLRIAGETLYAARAAGGGQPGALPVASPRVEDFRPRGRLNKGGAAPLLDAPALRLSTVDLPAGAPVPFPASITAPLPRRWLALRKRLPL